MPSHWKQPPVSPDLSGWDDVIDFILPVTKDYFLQLPRDAVFAGLGRKYDMRTTQIVECVRPNWYRLTPYGRFIQDRIRDAAGAD